ncbi:MAG: methyltransferase domain-containing protein [Actinobacteria bacterium]|nr:MAG: methyltransferase domain-containing protein [Actinomycetota bacterium]
MTVQSRTDSRLSFGPSLDAALLEILRCPVCRGRVREDAAGLACVECARSFAVEGGIPFFLHDDLPGARAKKREMDGWVAKAKSEGWYEPDDAIDRELPWADPALAGELWRANAHSFAVLRDRYLEQGMRALEVGAAKCWAAPHLLARGCSYVGTDTLTDSRIGLGRGAFYGEFPRVQADAEHLPFADEVFDLTFCVATLHHALELRAMVGELARVTRRGGLVCALNEGTRGLFASGDSPEQEAEKKLGINEHVHTVWAYAAAFAGAGLRIRRMERAEGWPLVGVGRLLERLPKVGMTLGTLLHLSTGTYAGVSIYSRKPA